MSLLHASLTSSKQCQAGVQKGHELFDSDTSGLASNEWKRYLNMTPDKLRQLLSPLPKQSQEEVKRYAANVMKGLRDALHYEELEKIFDLLK